MIFILIFLDVINGTVIYKNVLTKKKFLTPRCFCNVKTLKAKHSTGLLIVQAITVYQKLYNMQHIYP